LFVLGPEPGDRAVIRDQVGADHPEKVIVDGAISASDFEACVRKAIRHG